MSEMIERVARAIMETDIAMTLADYPDMPADVGRQSAEAMYETHYLPIARAAIEAMREPTPEMIENGVLAYNLTGIAGGIVNTAEQHVEFIWSAMLPASERQP